MSYTRRYGYFPSDSELTAIEGVVIVDLPPPASIQGAGTGTVCLIGEFPDMTLATDVNATTGAITRNYQPVEVYSAQDMIDKVGGWDDTLGHFGTTNGNGFAELAGLKFSRLVLIPIDLCSGFGCRVYRQLPPNAGDLDANPVVPLLGAVVNAGRQFVNGANGVNLAERVVFTDAAHKTLIIDAAINNAGAPAVLQAITRAAGSFITDGVVEGDAVQVSTGVNLAAGLDSPGGTYRVVSVDNALQITVERQDGLTFDWVTNLVTSLRIHPGETADSGPLNQLSEAQGSQVRVRATGPALIAADTVCTPVVVPTAATATTWSSLSGLGMHSPPAQTIDYVAAAQAANAALDTLHVAEYQAALDALLSETSPARDVNTVWCARKSTNALPGIASSLRAHVIEASTRGIGRMAITSPEMGTNSDSVTKVIAAAWPGAADTTASRNQRVIYAWPGNRRSVAQASGTTILGSDGTNVTDGILDFTSDGLMASALSLLQPERNPGQGAAPMDLVMSSVVGFDRDAPTLDMNSYIALKAAGICGLKNDRSLGFLFQSGITTSLIAGEATIARRRMADFLEDSIAARLVNFSKLPLTTALMDQMTGEVEQFLSSLKSEDNPATQRIVDYSVSDKEGNTAARLALGIFIITIRVRTLASADAIVLQAEVGEGVTINAV
jgi:hypothetical protein